MFCELSAIEAKYIRLRWSDCWYLEQFFFFLGHIKSDFALVEPSVSTKLKSHRTWRVCHRRDQWVKCKMLRMNELNGRKKKKKNVKILQ